MNFNHTENSDEAYLRAADCEDDIGIFLEEAWHCVDASQYSENWHLRAMAEHAMACINLEFKNLLVTIPPRCTKSTFFSVVLPTWVWGPANQPYTKFLTTSYSQTLSTRDAVKSRRLIQSRFYQRFWGDRFQLRADQNRKTRYENNKNGERLSSSVGGLGTGEGYDVLIVDDPLNAKQEYSEAALNEVIEWWSGTMSTRANDPKTARIIVVMQRITERDLAGHILEKEWSKDWCHLCLPMRYEKKVYTSPTGWKDPREEEGELLWPERLPEEQVRTLEKRLGSYKAAAQLQQRPAPEGGGIVKKRMFRYHEGESGYQMMIQTWDLTFDDGIDSDYVCGQVWGVKNADRYLIDMYREKADILAQARAIAKFYQKYTQTRAILVENKANGHAVAKLLKNPIEINGTSIQVRPITLVDPKKHGGSKMARLKNCIPEFESGCVYFPLKDVNPWVDKILEHELLFFPRAAHDDTVDCLSYALNWLAEHCTSLSQSYSDEDIVDLIQYKQDRQQEGHSKLHYFGGAESRGAILKIWD